MVPLRTPNTLFTSTCHMLSNIIHSNIAIFFYFPHKGIVATTYVLNPVHKIMLQPLRKLQDQEAQSNMLKHNHNRTYQNSHGRLLPRKNAIHLQKPIYLKCSHQGHQWHPLQDHRCKELTIADFLPSSKNIQTSTDLYLITLRSPPERYVCTFTQRTVRITK